MMLGQKIISTLQLSAAILLAVACLAGTVSITYVALKVKCMAELLRSLPIWILFFSSLLSGICSAVVIFADNSERNDIAVLYFSAAPLFANIGLIIYIICKSPILAKATHAPASYSPFNTKVDRNGILRNVENNNPRTESQRKKTAGNNGPGSNSGSHMTGSGGAGKTTKNKLPPGSQRKRTAGNNGPGTNFGSHTTGSGGTGKTTKNKLTPESQRNRTTASTEDPSTIPRRRSEENDKNKEAGFTDEFKKLDADENIRVQTLKRVTLAWLKVAVKNLQTLDPHNITPTRATHYLNHILQCLLSIPAVVAHFSDSEFFSFNKPLCASLRLFIHLYCEDSQNTIIDSRAVEDAFLGDFSGGNETKELSPVPKIDDFFEVLGRKIKAEDSEAIDMLFLVTTDTTFTCKMCNSVEKKASASVCGFRIDRRKTSLKTFFDDLAGKQQSDSAFCTSCGEKYSWGIVDLHARLPACIYVYEQIYDSDDQGQATKGYKKGEKIENIIEPRIDPYGCDFECVGVVFFNKDASKASDFFSVFKRNGIWYQYNGTTYSRFNSAIGAYERRLSFYKQADNNL